MVVLLDPLLPLLSPYVEMCLLLAFTFGDALFSGSLISQTIQMYTTSWIQGRILFMHSDVVPVHPLILQGSISPKFGLDVRPQSPLSSPRFEGTYIRVDDWSMSSIKM